MAAEPLAPLEYENSPNFLTGDNLAHALEFAHIFRYAQEPASERGCSLRGVYALRDEATRGSLVPVVYVCKANSSAEAGEIHRRVWNQNIVPFVLVQTPREIRLYSGFRYASSSKSINKATNPLAQGILNAAITFNDVASVLDAFRAEAIDDGTLWRRWGPHVTPETRVDWHLLQDLEELGSWLRVRGLPRETAHALIGKYVYLRYLRDRDILSDAKFAEWKIEPETVFGREATLDGLRALVDRLEEWLNGAVFPLDLAGPSAPRLHHLRMVASTFKGDCPKSGQRVLDFQVYDFSHIPIETLSVIYQQFLHAEGKGKTEGAYYTPLPLVNFVLEELDQRHPLKEGMRVCDPACGSGAFLVQCYRRLVERKIQHDAGKPPRPTELRDLLVNHIFGMDRNEDACRVAELSLTLTLLDYIEPPDLSKYPKFQLPPLHDRNIFQSDFFAPESTWQSSKAGEKFDWVIGNPPWKELNPQDATGGNRHVWQWIKENKQTYPTGGNQVAEACAWKVVPDLLNTPKGAVGLVLPAMTLFKQESAAFRKAFFEKLDVHCVANLANLAEVLFKRRSQGSSTRRRSKKGARLPTAVFFYQGSSPTCSSILTFAPLVANQEANRPRAGKKREETWSIVVNTSEIREIPLADAQEGSSLPWKLAMWGSARDRRLLDVLSKRFPPLRSFHPIRIVISEGLQLRRQGANEPVEHVPEIIGRKSLDFSRLRKAGQLFHLPRVAHGPAVEPENAYVRKGRVELPLQICKPPHVIVHASRNFAIYSDEFLIVPPRQIGIAGKPGDEDFLKALALFLSSAFATYHQFFISSEWGVQKNRTSLDDLRAIPMPVFSLARAQLAEWSQLYQRLVLKQAYPDGFGRKKI